MNGDISTLIASGGDASVMADLSASGWQVLWLLVVAGIVIAGLRALRLGIDLAPLNSRRRTTLQRILPVVSSAVGVLFLFFATGSLFERHPDHFPLALTLLAGAIAAASWSAIRDVVSGVFVKSGRVCQVGDYVRVGDVQGRVERLGLRVLVIETSRGEEAILPYRQVTSEAVLRTPVQERGTLHIFELSFEEAPEVAPTKALIREAALCSHWSAIARPPEVAVVDPRRYEVTIFAVDPDRVQEVETAVRNCIFKPSAPRGDERARRKPR